MYEDQDLNYKRPSHIDEDIRVVKGLRSLTDMIKALLTVVRSGPVEDTLASILTRLTTLQRKYDTHNEEELTNANPATQLPYAQ